MLTKLRTVIFGSVPILMLVSVLVAGLKIVQSETGDTRSNGVVARSMGSAVTSPVKPVVKPAAVAADQAVEIKAKAAVTPENTVAAKPDSENEKKDMDEVWREIDDAISGLNKLVGHNMFLKTKRSDKGQLEVYLDRQYWDRVSYITRVDLKTDISNLWHLYVNEYKNYDSSVVYFIDDANTKVIDIFSRSN